MKYMEGSYKKEEEKWHAGKRQLAWLSYSGNLVA